MVGYPHPKWACFSNFVKAQVLSLIKKKTLLLCEITGINTIPFSPLDAEGHENGKPLVLESVMANSVPVETNFQDGNMSCEGEIAFKGVQNDSTVSKR